MATASDTRTVVGVFNSVQDAQNAVRELESAGISRDDISIVANKNAVGYDRMDSADRDKASDVIADAGIGAAIGGVGGLLLSAAGALTIPVIGPVLAAGPIAAALTGAGIGAAAGGLVGALTESGVPEEHAHYYAEGVRRGDVLVTVKATRGLENTAADILDRHNALDVDQRVENWRQRGWSGWRDDQTPFTPEEYRRERSFYTESTLTGVSGLAVDRERASLDRDELTGVGHSSPGISGTGGIDVDQQRSNLHRDRDDLQPPVSGSTTTKRSDMTGDIYGHPRSEAGFTTSRDTDASLAGTGDLSNPGGTYSGGVAGQPPLGDSRSTMEKAGDKMREWKEDMKDAFRDDERQRTGAWNTEVRDTGYDSRSEHPAERNVGAWADETRGDFGSADVRTSPTDDRKSEMRRDLEEAWRDTKDIAQGRTGKQPHDIREDAREAERRRRARVYGRTIL